LVPLKLCHFRRRLPVSGSRISKTVAECPGDRSRMMSLHDLPPFPTGPDYSQAEGARFEIHFEKARGFYGPEAEPFEAHLIGHEWKLGPIKSGDDAETLKALHSQGISVRDIADRTGVPRSTVHRRLNGGIQ
jgi:hypothetical protein